MHWMARLGHAFQHELLELYCQPIATLGGGAQLLHYDILLRMNDGAGAPISPRAFLPAAERYAVMLKIDRWCWT